MKKVRKRVFSFLLAFVMMISLLPTTAWAAADTEGWQQANTHVLDEVTVTEYYKMVDVGGYNEFRYMLVVKPNSGSGSLPNYASSEEVPWNRNAQYMSTIYIEDGVTTIGDFCFADMPLLETVTIEDPSDLTYIGKSAFVNDRKLTISVKDSGSRIFNIPNVTEIGDSAFANCVLLGSGNATIQFGSKLTAIGNSAFSAAAVKNIQFAPLDDGNSLTIGNNAFAWCGIQSMDLPEGLTTIGDYAFAYNSLSGSLVLPDSTTSVGNYAFYVSSDSKNRNLTELTLGKNLGYIGESAFQNYIQLKTVQIRTTNTDLTLGNKAFGHDQTDAYWTDKEIDGENYFVGADFRIADESISQEDQAIILSAFENGVNCYLGAVSPLRLVDTVAPTCLTNGRHTYEYTLTLGTGHQQTKQLYEILPAIEHEWNPATPNSIQPSCEQPGGSLYVCMNAHDLAGQTVTDTEGKKVTVLADGSHYRFDPSSQADDQPTDHHYQPLSATNAEINGDTGTGTTTLTYACDQPRHVNAGDPDFNSYGNVVTPDTLPEQVDFTINWKKITVTTLTTLGDIQNQLANVVAGNAGTLSIVYEDGQSETTTLNAGSYRLKLKFTPSTLNSSNYSGMAESSTFGGETLTLTGTVNKVALDFTDVFFQDAGTTVSDKLPPVSTTIANPGDVPAHTSGPDFYYRAEHDLDGWQTDPPERSASARWVVKAEYTIDTSLYTVTDLIHDGTATGYALTYEESSGKVILSAPYVISPRQMSSITATAANGTYGDGNDTNRLQLSNVPGSSTVYYTVTKDGVPGTEQSVTTSWSDWEETRGMSIGTFTQAGTYKVQIRVENTSGNYSPSDYTLPEQTIIVAKKVVPTPVGNTLTYEPDGPQQGIPSGNGYTLDPDTCFASDAGTYKGTVTLTDPDNTKWESTDEAAIQVSFTINPRPVAMPTMTSGFVTSNPFNGTEYTAAQKPTSTAFTYRYVDGELIGSYKGHPVVTVSDAQRTDAGTYHTVATLNNPSGKQNYIWLGTSSSAPITLVNSWIIRRANYTLPAITVDGDNSVGYTGMPLDESKIRFDTQDKDSYSLPLVSPDVLTVGSFSWLKNGQPLKEAPTDVGEYQLKVTFTLSDQAKLSNYTFSGDDSSADNVITKTIPVTITKATLSLQAGAEKSTPYTGSGIEIPSVTVESGLIGNDTAEDVAMTYSYTPAGEGQATQTQSTPFTFTDVGTYSVSVQPASTSNYTADPVTVTLTITTAEQKIRLEAESGTELIGQGTQENPYTVTKELADTSFFITGHGYVADGTSNGHATAAEVSYSSSLETVAAVSGNGTVQIKGAGTTRITVTAKEDTSGKNNYGQGSVAYTLTVNKATPTIDTSPYNGKFETPYTGSPITGYQKAILSAVSGILPTGDLIYTFYTDDACANKVTNGGGTDGNIPIQVGRYFLQVTYAGDSNYNAAVSQVIPVEITKASIDHVTVAPYSGVYDGKSHSLNQQPVTVPGFDSAQYSVQYAQSASQPAATSDVWNDDITVKNVADSTSTSTKYWYKVTIDGNNYAPVIGSIDVQITPAELTVTGVPGSFEKAYDGNTSVTTDLSGIAVNTGVAGESILTNATGSYADKNAADHKEVTLVLTLSGLDEWGNYSYEGTVLTEGKVTLKQSTGKITPKPIAVTGGITAMDKVYDGTTDIVLSGTPVTDGFVAADATENSVFFRPLTSETGTVENANVDKDKLVTVTQETLNRLLDGTDKGNYTVAADYVAATADITPRPVYLLFPGQAYGEAWSTTVPYNSGGLLAQLSTYKASPQAPDAHSGFVKSDGLADGDIAYTFTDRNGSPVENPKDLGEYTVTAKLADTVGNKFSNYQIDAISGTIEITQNTDVLNVTITPKPDLIYTGQGQDPIQSIDVQGGSEGLTENDGYQISYSLSNDGSYNLTRTQLADAVKDAGTYTIYWKVNTTNYGNKEGSFEVTIEKAQLLLSRTVTASKSYDGTTDAAAQVTGVSLTGQVGGEVISAALSNAEYNQATVKDANTIIIMYTLNAEGTAILDNYTVKIAEGAAADAAASMTETVSAVITAAPITVTVGNQAAVYSGTTPTVSSRKDTDWTANGTIFELEPGTPDDLGIQLSIPNGTKNVGVYPITGEASNTNYNVQFTQGQFTITARPVTIAIGNTNGFYGNTPVLTGVTLTDSTVPAQDQGMVGSDSTELFRHLPSTTADATKGVGDYPILASDGVHGNYDVRFLNGTYTVNKRPVTVTISNQSSLYGQDIVSLVPSVDNMANGEDLGVQLKTDAVKGSDVGLYPIYVQSKNEAIAANYDVTVVGETPFGGETDKATYSIREANLEIAFPNESVNVSIGGAVNNPLKFTNASNNEVLHAKPGDVTVKYTSQNPQVAMVDESTGDVTILSAGDTTITAEVTDGGKNFIRGATARYELRVATAGQGIQVYFGSDQLTYDGTAQTLMEVTGTYPASGVTVEYTLDKDSGTWSTTCPTGTKAGLYTVYWRASADGYTTTEPTPRSVRINQAELTGAFQTDPFTYVLTAGTNSYDSAVENALALPSDYTGTALSYMSSDPNVALAVNGGSTIRILDIGDTIITVSCPEDPNYKAHTFQYVLKVVDQAQWMDVSAPDVTTSYDGNPHGISVQVITPASGYTIKYGTSLGSYPLTQSPTYTDAGEYTVFYQVTAPGYETYTGSAKVNIQPKQLMDEMVSNVGSNYTYTGGSIHPIPIVTDGNILLTEGRDYTVTYGENLNIGSGSVTVEAMAGSNYTGSVTKYFTISPADAKYLTASLDRYYGTYGDSTTNTAQVTVKFSNTTLTVGTDYTIDCDTAHGCTVSGNQITFTEVGSHQVTINGTGNYQGETAVLTYTLLPAASHGGLNLTVNGQVTPYITTYGEPIDGTITVEAPDNAGTALDPQYYDLTYVYYDHLGSQPTQPAAYTADILSQGTPEAGMYVVTATAKLPYSGSGSYVFVILKRDLADADVSASLPTGLIYTGSAQTPDIALSYHGTVIGNVTTRHLNNVNAGQAQAVSSADGDNNNFTGTRVDNFIIAPKSIENGFIAAANPNEYNYTGQVVIPTVEVTDTATLNTLNPGSDYTVTSTAIQPGSYKATVTGTGNYTGRLEVDFTITGDPGQPVTGLELTVTPETWIYSATPTVDISVTFDGQPISDYTLTVVKDGTEVVANGTAAQAIAALVKPGSYTITANGTGAYMNTSDTATVTIDKAKLPLTITVDPSIQIGSGTVQIQVVPGTWPLGMDSTRLTKLTVNNSGTLHSTLPLEYDSTAGSYGAVSFSCTNETAVYTFGIDTAEIAGFDPDCYTLEITGGVLNVIQQTSGGGGGGGGGSETVTYTITASAGEHGSINPAGKVSVVKGQDASFVFTADDGWQVADVLVDGVSVGALSSYTFTKVSANHTISVTFEEDTRVADPNDTGVSDWLITGEHVLYLSGYGQNLFGPTDSLTRAQAAQLFYNLLLEKDVPLTVSFTDVPADAWYAKAVHTLASLGIVEGVGDGLFDPDRAITRAEFTAIAMRFAKPNVISANIFPDVSQDDWFYDQATSAVQYGWINGYADGTFGPQNPITRAEVTVITNRMLGRVADQTFVDSHKDDLVQFTDVSPYYWAYYEIMEATNAHYHTKVNGTEHWNGLR